MIFTTIPGPSMKEALAQIRASAPYSDGFELRLDLIEAPHLDRLFKAAGKPVIATCRTAREGGKWRGTGEQRTALLLEAVRRRPAFVDVEMREGKRGVDAIRKARKGQKVLVSHHVRGKDLPDAKAVLETMLRMGADVCKLAYAVEDATQIIPAVEFLARAQQKKTPAIAVAMGAAGEASRVLYRHFGGWATFASPEGGGPVAEGQIPARILKTIYRADTLGPRTQVFGVVGFPLGQSKGPLVHNPLFARARKNAVYCRFPAANFDTFMQTLAPRLEGFSVTIPHKRAVLRYLDEVDPAALFIGAVNTVLRTKNGWRGLNTDAPAALDAIESKLPVEGRTMLVLGAGGAARAIVAETRRRGGHPVIAARSGAKCRQLAREFGVGTVAWEERTTIDADFLVNATPVGMVPDAGATPFPAGGIRALVAFDAVFNPRETRFLREARAAGSQPVYGTEMYIRQAAEQSFLYTGVRPPLSQLRALLA